MLTLPQALARYPGSVAFKFGDSATLNAEILGLIRAGRKTMTCAPWKSFADNGEALPEVGRIDITLDWAGMPALALRTVAVERIPFNQMDEARVGPQGEFRDLAHWRAGYEAYLRRSGSFTPDVAMMVETFEIVEDFRATQSNADAARRGKNQKRENDV
jgi:uncharacterized protein YhfF